jgi:hypothetical protein
VNESTSPETSVADLMVERETLEPHMQVDGGCRDQMFLGDCADCRRYFEVDALVRERQQQLSDAAPDLLAALRTLVTLPNVGVWPSDVYQQVKAAIARATGGAS